MLISSMSSTFGCWISARAMASICCSPPDSAPARSVHRFSSAGKKSSRSRGDGPPRGRDLQVLLDGERREQAAVVGHEHDAGAVRQDGPPGLERLPSTATVPSCGGRMPATVSRKVVLPAPFGPSSASIVPASTERSTSRKAMVVPRPPGELGALEPGRHAVAAAVSWRCRGRRRPRRGWRGSTPASPSAITRPKSST